MRGTYSEQCHVPRARGADCSQTLRHFQELVYSWWGGSVSICPCLEYLPKEQKQKRSQLGCLLSSLVHFNCKLVGVAFPFLTFLAPSLLLRLSLLEARITGRGGVPGTRCVSSLCHRSWLNTALTLSGSRCDVCVTGRLAPGGLSLLPPLS